MIFIQWLKRLWRPAEIARCLQTRCFHKITMGRAANTDDDAPLILQLMLNNIPVENNPEAVNTQDFDSRTPLHLACDIRGAINSEMLTHLIQSGSNAAL